jgi:hypothetical protein
MKKGDCVPLCARARIFLDQQETLTPESVDLLSNVINNVAL